MGEGKTHDHHHRHHQDSWFQYGDHMKSSDSDENFTSSSSTSSIHDSMDSNGSSLSSCDTADDASSSASSSFSMNSSGGLYDLSEIMAQLPIKRGLSKFYQGKSESFTSLSSVTSLEDLAKKTPPYRKKLKSSKSCGAGLNSYKPYTLPKAIISKRSSVKGSLASTRRGSCVFSRPPLSPQPLKNLEC